MLEKLRLFEKTRLLNYHAMRVPQASPCVRHGFESAIDGVTDVEHDIEQPMEARARQEGQGGADAVLWMRRQRQCLAEEKNNIRRFADPHPSNASERHRAHSRDNRSSCERGEGELHGVD